MKSGELSGSLWIALIIHGQRSFWEVAEELLGEVQGTFATYEFHM